MIRAALILVCLAAPAAAQTEERFAIDPHLIDRCLAVNDETPMRCVGRQADACILRNGNGPNMVVSVCHGNEAAFWDDFLNRMYQDALDLARATEAQDVGYVPDSLSTSLRDMQRAWIAYRDAACAHEAARWRPFGSASGAATNKCFMRQTARQVFELQSIAQAYRAQEYAD